VYCEEGLDKHIEINFNEINTGQAAPVNNLKPLA
jgi:hypothetical protein